MVMKDPVVGPSHFLYCMQPRTLYHPGSQYSYTWSDHGEGIAYPLLAKYMRNRSEEGIGVKLLHRVNKQIMYVGYMYMYSSTWHV